MTTRHGTLFPLRHATTVLGRNSDHIIKALPRESGVQSLTAEITCRFSPVHITGIGLRSCMCADWVMPQAVFGGLNAICRPKPGQKIDITGC